MLLGSVAVSSGPGPANVLGGRRVSTAPKKPRCVGKPVHGSASYGLTPRQRISRAQTAVIGVRVDTTAQAIEYARHATRLGADALIALLGVKVPIQWHARSTAPRSLLRRQRFAKAATAAVAWDPAGGRTFRPLRSTGWARCFVWGSRGRLSQRSHTQAGPDSARPALTRTGT